jgi:hypothetical protein
MSMPIDSSIYQNLKPTQMPDLADAAQKGMTLSQMGLQQKRMTQELASHDKEQAYTDHLRKASVLGNALESLSGLQPQERAIAYPKARLELIQSGVLKPEEAPEEYDDGFYRQSLSRFQNSKEGIERQLQQAQIAKLKRDAERGEADPLARQMAMLDAREEYAKRKENEKLQRYSNMGGWKLSEGATPTMDDAKKFKSGSAAAMTLLNNLNEFQGLIGKHGAELMPGDAKNRLNSLARDIQLSAKNEDLYSLGVLTGPDLKLLEEIIDAPTGFWENMNPWAGNLSQSKAQQFREMINNRINSKAKTYGFEPTPEWQTLASGGLKKKEEGKSSGFGGNEAYAAEAPPQIKPGHEEDNYTFMGGDPGDRKNWKRTK